MFTNASAYSSNATSTIHAQVYHSVGVNEYGTDILEKSEIEYNVPATISVQDTQLEISMVLDDMPIVVSANLSGRNLSDNLLYFDAECSAKNIEVMSFTYNRNFNPKAAITSNYSKLYPEATDVLKVYLKVKDSNLREYYFIEFFDFLLEDFDSIMDNAEHCDPDYWCMREFKPVKSGLIENNAETRGIATSGSYIVYDYYDVLNIEYMAKMDVEVNDTTDNIPLGGDLTWTHNLNIQDKATVCPSVSDYESDDCYLEIDSACLKVGAPRGAAYIYTVVDGEVQKDSGIGNLSSASISAGIGPFSVSFDLSGAFQFKSNVDLNENFDSYVNKPPANYTTTVTVEFD